jgi:glycosyltransferase involved in cell wall biosynthesis
MHIVFICNEYPPPVSGGIGAFTQTLARQLVANGHRVTVVGVYRIAANRESQDQGVRVIRLASRGPRGMRAFIDGHALWNFIQTLEKTEHVDVIDGPEMSFWNAPQSLAAPCSLRMNGGHHFFSAAEGRSPRRIRAQLEKRSFRRADHLCAVTSYVAEETRKLLDLPNEPIEVLHNPVDVVQFQPRPEIRAVPGRIVFLGTVCEKKGIRQLLEAMPQIRRQVPAAHLIAAGREWCDPDSGDSYTAHLLRHASIDAIPSVQFVGAVDHESVPSLLASAEVCVFPSLMESQGIVWAEAMAMGRPLVASSLGPGPEVVKHGVTGVLCDPRDVSALADSVIRLLRDPDLRSRLGAAARTEAASRFSVVEIAARNEAWFGAITRHAHARPGS